MEASIYVLPSEEGKPPRAIVGYRVSQNVMQGVEVFWQDGQWLVSESNVPLPDEMGEAVTEHARSLGVIVVESSGA